MFLLVTLADPGGAQDLLLERSTPAGDRQERFARVRGAGAEIRRLIREADSRSSTFRDLVNRIGQSNAIVVVQFGKCRNGRYRACLSFVGGDMRHRHIRILVDMRGTGYRLMATIAHELHHAVEVIRDPTVVDRASALALYRKIGLGDCREGLSDACETDEALKVEARVFKELYGVGRDDHGGDEEPCAG